MGRSLDLESELVKLLRAVESNTVDREAFDMRAKCLDLLVKVRVAEKRAAQEAEDQKIADRTAMIDVARRKAQGIA